MGKKILILFFIIMTILLCSCCESGHSPWKQVDTYWVSEDGNIWFYVTRKYYSVGEITVDGTSYPVIFLEDHGEISVLSEEAFHNPFIETNDEYEFWFGDYSWISNDSFVAKVEASTFFQRVIK